MSADETPLWVSAMAVCMLNTPDDAGAISLEVITLHRLGSVPSTGSLVPISSGVDQHPFDLQTRLASVLLRGQQHHRILATAMVGQGTMGDGYFM